MDNEDNTVDPEPAMEDDKADANAQKTRNIRHSVSEGSYVSKFWRAHTDREWTANSSSDDITTKNNEDDVSGVSLKENLRLVLSPSSNYRRRQSRNKNGPPYGAAAASDVTAITRFHKDLKTDDLDGMVVVFQAKAEQCISVVLSPWPSIETISCAAETKIEKEIEADKETEIDKDEEKDKEIAEASTEVSSAAVSTRYEVVLGANNNTATTIRKIICDTTAISTTIPSRVCRGFGADVDTTSGVDSDSDVENDNNNSDTCWTSYWVCLSNSRLYVGMGKVPGKECFGVLEEEEQQQQQGDLDQTLAIPYVGIGNDAAVRKHKDSIVKIKNLLVTNVPPCLESLLQTLPSQDDLPIVCLPPVAAVSSGMDVDEDAETLELKKCMEDFKAECLVRKQRAAKYGTDYKEQPMKKFLPWTMAKRLQLQGKRIHLGTTTKDKNSTGGIVAGDIDFLDPNEIAKREARRARFVAENGDGEVPANPETGTNGIEETIANGKVEGLPLEQAWDKEAMLRPIRRDPPSYLWKESPSNAETIHKTTHSKDPFSMYDDTTKAATWIPDKLHVSAIDWAAFKQIRNDDLVQHLAAYGPIKYIEWLGDVSCNVCFANKASASRALVCLSNDLPSPPPEVLQLLSTDGGAKGEEISNSELPTMDAAPNTTINTTIDLGCMTWRFGKRPIRKVSNDRHGKKGTTARYLLRVATTEDVLIERPSSWPEPPGRFASDRVLGPKSDCASARNHKPLKNKNKSKKNNNNELNSNSQQQQQHKQLQQQQQNRRGSDSKRKRGRGETNGNQNRNNQGKNERKKKNNKNKNNNHNKASSSSPMDLLNQGLSSSRGGFSVEDMEKERQAKKRRKTC